MRQRWLSLLLSGTLLCFQSGFTLAEEARSAFLVLNTGADITDTVNRMEAQGVRIFSQVPPSIMTVEIPAGLTLKNITAIKTIYQSAVPLSALEPLGTIAMAAGMKWNRSLLSSTLAANVASFGAMRSLVSQKSLSAPADVTVSQDKSIVNLAWKAVPSALFYEVEAARDASFSNRIYQTKTSELHLNAPTPEESDAVDIYYRVRAADHGDDDHLRQNDIFSAWSSPLSLRITPTTAATTLKTPTLSSPLNNYESEGFTLILEWMDIGASRYRVQVALDAGFKNPLFDAVVTEREFICPSPAMQLSDTLYWRVKSWDDAKSDWTVARHFTIGMPHSAKSDFFVNPEAPK